MNPQNPGDNWMLFDNLTFSAPDLRITSIAPLGDGSLHLEWTVSMAGSYQVQISSDLAQ